VCPARRDRFTVTPQQLDSHIAYLKRAGFTFIRAGDLVCPDSLPQRPLLLTFDDGYLDNLAFAHPVLAKHGARATIFVVTGYTGEIARWESSASMLMSVEDLHTIDPSVFELALHSHWHRPFAALSIQEIEKDLHTSIQFFTDHQIPFTAALAYPFGSRPKCHMAEFGSVLENLGISIAFRIGNRINRLPLPSRYEVQRIDVSGDASDMSFRRKLWVGKLL
jgi:peptidoglycan/xylan/chitin deacetylase (PgdA/CDA1 family)